MSELIALFGTLQMQIIVILIAIDVVLGIIGGIVKKDLVLGKLANFMKEPVLAYVLGFAVIEMVGQALPKLALIVPVVFVLIVIALLASILKNLGKFGLPLPKVLSK
ncbi:MAG: phage holin family protein [bacterium]|nr:phage holin family protein [bacterium]